MRQVTRSSGTKAPSPPPGLLPASKAGPDIRTLLEFAAWVVVASAPASARSSQNGSTDGVPGTAAACIDFLRQELSAVGDAAKRIKVGSLQTWRLFCRPGAAMN